MRRARARRCRLQRMLRGYVCDRIRLSPADSALSAQHKTLPSASLATLVARLSLRQESNHFKIGEINDQNFAAMPENRR